jgi:hypothetical protein
MIKIKVIILYKIIYGQLVIFDIKFEQEGL